MLSAPAPVPASPRRSAAIAFLGASCFFWVSESAAQSKQLPWTVLETEVIGRQEALGGIASAALAADGSVYALDYTTSTVFKYDANGKLLWRAGRKGRGPGEFVQAYRIGARPAGGVVVFDAATNAVTLFDAKGRYENRFPLDQPRFAQADDIVQVPSGEIVIAGMVRMNTVLLDSQPTPGSLASLHVFSRDLKYLRSFGPLPDAREKEVLRFWGAGYLSVASNGDLLFARKLPYEVYRYSVLGSLIAKVSVERSVNARPDDFISIGPSPADPSAVRYKITSKDVPRPARPFLLSGTLLVTGLLSEKSRTIDVVDSKTGAVVASTEMERGWQTLVGFDPRKSVLWIIAEVDDEAVLLRQVIALTQSDPSLRSPP